MLTHFIDGPHPEPNSTIVLYYYSNDFPSVIFKPFTVSWALFESNKIIYSGLFILENIAGKLNLKRSNDNAN